jgi:peroxiredoxin
MTMRIGNQSWIIGTLCTAAALVVVLAQQNAMLRETLHEQAAQPRVGDWVPSYLATRSDGTPLSLGESTPPRLLYFFHPKCPHCIASEAAISRVAAQLRDSQSVEFLGISAASNVELATYEHGRSNPFPTAHLDTKKMFSLFRVSAVPTLLLVDREGTVRYSHAGEVVGEDGASELLKAVDGALIVH